MADDPETLAAIDREMRRRQSRQDAARRAQMMHPAERRRLQRDAEAATAQARAVGRRRTA